MAADGPGTDGATNSERTTFRTASFAAPTDFAQALKLAKAASDLDVVGLRFENDQIVGEYFLGSDKSPEVFLREFADRYGTVPQVSGLVVQVPWRDPKTDPPFEAIAAIVTGTEAFSAPPIPVNKIEELFRLPDTLEADLSSEAVTPSALLATPIWEPISVFAGTWRDGSSQIFVNAIDWYDPTSPQDIPDGYGLEVEINLLNEATGIRGSV